MSYDWIKPGAKYRVVSNESGHRFAIDAVVWSLGVDNDFTDGEEESFLGPDEVEEVAVPVLEVGKTYTSKNGHEWLCVAVYGEYAYMRNADTPQSSAYCFKTDGTNISQGGGGWDVRFEPVREPIEVHGSFNRGFYDYAPDYITHHQQMGEHKFTMTIDMVDGEPDWSSAKLTGA